MRPQYEGSLPDAIRAVANDLEGTLNQLETLASYELPGLTAQNLLPSLRQLIKARASLGMAAVAAEMEGLN